MLDYSEAIHNIVLDPYQIAYVPDKTANQVFLRLKVKV